MMPDTEGNGPHHRQVSTTLPDGTVIHVDEQIEPLLQKLWGMGILTWASCQEVRGPGSSARIWFASAEDRDKFESIWGGWRSRVGGSNYPVDFTLDNSD